MTYKRLVAKYCVAASFALASLSAAHAEIVFGEKNSEYGYVSVDENLANPKYPNHFISLEPLEGSSNGGNLLIRCRDNKTEVFYAAPESDFFGISSSPRISIRYASEETSKSVSASGSSGMGKAAFFRDPIGFSVKLINEGSVVISGSYYSSSFVALFKVDDIVADGVYGAAETCGWSKKLPKRDSITVSVSADVVNDLSLETTNQPTTDEAIQGLDVALRALIDKYGMEAVLDATRAAIQNKN